MVKETHRWIWLLFRTSLPAQRAKALLYRWHRQGLTVEEVLRRLPGQAQALGLTAEEAAALRPPERFPEVAALRWDEPTYPAGLRDLPLKLRPAVLFYAGRADLLLRPRIYLPPTVLTPEAHPLLHEAVSILLGEELLPATFRESEQAALLMDEMEIGEGEILLFTRSGLDQVELTEREQELVDAGRLLLVTPLPPETGENPAWEAVLQQLARASVDRCITTDLAAATSESAPPTLLLSEGSLRQELPATVMSIEDPALLIPWLADVTAVSPDRPPMATPAGETGELLTELPPEPPPTPEEALRTLQSGGQVPEVLRRRLFGEKED